MKREARGVTGFVLLILVGTVLLALPGSAAGPALDVVDALFLATSAVCVTGLSTVTVGEDLSWFGQIVLLVLIQLGALGISLLSITLLVAAGRATIQSHAAAREQLAAVRVRPLRLVWWVVAVTLLAEVAGMLVLRGAFVEDDTLFNALFHSVSAFCNAGFSLYPDSLEGAAGTPVVLWTIAALIALGGLGFIVLREIVLWVVALVRGKRPRLMLHGRTVLWSSLVLWVAGAVAFALLEMNATMAGMSMREVLEAAMFQSVTTRTAGFSSLDFSSLRGITLFGTMLLMFVGGGPGGVAGGVKVTTVVVVLATLRSWLRGSSTVWLMGRTIPAEIVRRAYQLVIWSFLFVGLMVSILVATQEHMRVSVPDYFMAVTFEVVSAFGTVGLSTGITSSLTPVGKVAIVLTMLVGRIGPLVFAVIVLRPRAAPSFDYPEEELATG